MPYILDTVIYAGAGNTDPALMQAQFKAHGLVSVAALPAATLIIANDPDEFYFKHSGNGWFNFHTELIPEGFRGIVEFRYDGSLFAVLSINPQELEPSSGASGGNTVTITIEDSLTNDPIQNAQVTVKTIAGNIVDQKLTNGDGDAVFHLVNGDYLISVLPSPSYSSESNVALTVNGNESLTIELDAVAPSVPSSPGLCVVRTVVERNGVPVTGAVMSAYLIGRNQVREDATQSTVVVSDTSGADGVVELQLLRLDQFDNGGTYRIKVVDGDNIIFDLETTIPNQALVQLDDLVV